MKHKYLKNVATLRLLPEKCTGCGLCAKVCPHRVFEITDRKARITNDSCIECGACAENCPANAIFVSAGVGCAELIINGWFAGREPAAVAYK